MLGECRSGNLNGQAEEVGAVLSGSLQGGENSKRKWEEKQDRETKTREVGSGDSQEKGRELGEMGSQRERERSLPCMSPVF